jgi:hypothetical protein
MVALKPTVVLAGALGGAIERKAVSVAGVQLVQKGRVTWTAKPFWLRNMPSTAAHPTDAQLVVRQEFARLAKEAKERGETGTKKRGFKEYKGMKLPGAAAYVGTHLPAVKEYIKRNKLSYEARGETPPSRTWRTVHTWAHIEAMMRARGIEPATRWIGAPAEKTEKAAEKK